MDGKTGTRVLGDGKTGTRVLGEIGMGVLEIEPGRGTNCGLWRKYPCGGIITRSTAGTCACRSM